VGINVLSGAIISMLGAAEETNAEVVAAISRTFTGMLTQDSNPGLDGDNR